MQVETAVARPQIQFMAFNHSEDAGFHAVEREVESPVNAGRTGEGEVARVDRQRRRTVAVF